MACRTRLLRGRTIDSNPGLNIENSAEQGSEAIAALAGSSLSKSLTNGSTAFDVPFRLLRPGILHVTIYNMDNHDRNDNTHEGIYLGEVVFEH